MAEELRADVIIPGENPLNMLLARERIAKIGGATVIDGFAATFKMAEMMVDLHRSSGMLLSRRVVQQCPGPCKG